MGKKNESLQELKERQAELARADQDKATLAARIAALEQAEAQRAQAEAQAAENARVQAARAALDNAEVLAVRALQALQERLEAVQQSAASVGGFACGLPDDLFLVTRYSLEWLKHNRPEIIGLPPHVASTRLERLHDNLSRLQELAKGVDHDGARNNGYTSGIKRLKEQIAMLEGRTETEPEASAADLAYMQAMESATKTQEGMAGLVSFFRKG